MAVDVIHFDYETRSEQDLRKVGAFRYAEDPTTEALCMVYKVNEDREKLWKMSEPCPPRLQKLLKKGALFVAHNIQFDANIWEHTCEWGHIPVSQRRDSAAYAAALALPRDLDGVGNALGLPVQKSKEGHKLMMKMCKPRRPSKANPAKYWELPEQLENLYEYCIRDVETESLLANSIRPLIDIEQKVWEVSERINARGVRIDVRAVEIILDMLEQASENAKDMLLKYGLPRDSINKRDKVLQWVKDQGYEMPGYTKADVKRALADPDCPSNVKVVLSIRQRVGKSSTAKYKKIMEQVCKDKRIRGTMLYHGASTGRWAGRGLQPQNMPRGSVKDTDEALADILEDDLGWVEMLHGDFFEVASSCIRGVLTATPGNRLIVCDYSAIEARVLAWVARQEDIIEVFRGHGKIYEHTASGIYNVEVEDVTKEQRFIGKVASLACIAQGQEVLTDKGLVSIEHVTRDMKVWDGTEWVSHGGRVYRGEREVIKYDGLEATADHIVFTSQGEMQFGEAARSGTRLLQSGAGGEAVRVGEDNICRKEIHKRVERGVRTHRVSRLWKKAMAVSSQLNNRALERMSALFPTKAYPTLAGQTHYLTETALPKCERRELRKLRSERDRVQVRQRSRGRTLGSRDSRAAGERNGTGQNRQQRALREREYSLGDKRATADKQKKRSAETLSPISSAVSSCQVRRQYSSQSHRKGADLCRNRGSVLQTQLQTERRVWDLLDCGPRNRFTVSGKLVHNCGYGGGKKAFKSMADMYGVDISEEKAQQTVTAYRESNSDIVSFWYAVEKSAKKAIRKPGTIVTLDRLKFQCKGGFLKIRLPIGRNLYYYKPRIEDKEAPWGMTEQITFMGMNSMTHKWMRLSTYSGKLVENIVQAIARDLLAEAMIRCEDAGYPIVLSIHDELVADVPEGVGSLEEFTKIMTELPDWAEDMPVRGAGFEAFRYKKD